MSKIRSITTALATAALCAIAASGAALAASDWPTRPVRVIVPWAVGGGTEPLARLVLTDLATRLGQPFVLDFRPGAAGTVGAGVFAQQRPDGQTILFTSGSPAVNANFMRNVSYDPKTDLVPVTQLVDAPNYIAANAKTPYNTFQELIEYAKAHPGEVKAGVSGLGGNSHLSASVVQYKTGVKFLIVPYGGAGAQLANLMSGEVDVGLGFATAFMPGVKLGKLKYIAALSDKRTADLPHVPASDESPYKGIHRGSWFMVFVPKGTPRAIIDKMNAEFRTTINTPGIKRKIEALNYQIVGGSPEDAAAVIKFDTEQMKALIDAGVITMTQ